MHFIHHIKTARPLIPWVSQVKDLKGVLFHISRNCPFPLSLCQFHLLTTGIYTTILAQKDVLFLDKVGTEPV